MSGLVDRPSRWNDIFGWISCAFFVVSVLVFLTVATGVKFIQDGILGMGALGIFGFLSGLVGTIKGLNGRTAILSLMGMLFNILPAGILLLAYAGMFRT